MRVCMCACFVRVRVFACVGAIVFVPVCLLTASVGCIKEMHLTVRIPYHQVRGYKWSLLVNSVRMHKPFFNKIRLACSAGAQENGSLLPMQISILQMVRSILG